MFIFTRENHLLLALLLESPAPELCDFRVRLHLPFPQRWDTSSTFISLLFLLLFECKQRSLSSGLLRYPLWKFLTGLVKRGVATTISYFSALSAKCRLGFWRSRKMQQPVSSCLEKPSCCVGHDPWSGTRWWGNPDVWSSKVSVFQSRFSPLVTQALLSGGLLHEAHKTWLHDASWPSLTTDTQRLLAAKVCSADQGHVPVSVTSKGHNTVQCWMQRCPWHFFAHSQLANLSLFPPVITSYSHSSREMKTFGCYPAFMTQLGRGVCVDSMC